MKANISTNNKFGEGSIMKSSTSYRNMLTSMKKTINDLLSEGKTQDALVLLNSESIIRAHFAAQQQSSTAIRGNCALVDASL